MNAQMRVVRFCTLTGVPRSTWYRWRAAGSSAKGPWPTPAQDAIEVDAKAKADEWDAWGHRKIAELLRLDDGHRVSDSTVYRVLARHNRTLPSNYTGQVGVLN